MKFFVATAIGLFILSSAQPVYAQNVSEVQVGAVNPPRASDTLGASTSVKSVGSPQAIYRIPDAVRPTVERDAQLRAMEEAASGPLPTINAAETN